MNFVNVIAFTLPSVLFLTAPCFASDVPLAIDGIVQNFVRSDHFQGTVGVQKNGNIIFKKGYGDAAIEYHVANVPETKFRIASLSKQFTATAILLLQQDGKLSISDRVSRYIAAAPDAWKDITIQALLNHSAGLVRDIPLGDDRYGEYHTVEELLGSIKTAPITQVSDGKAVYSNAGYAVLAAIIEKVSGLKYGEFLERRIFSVAGLTNTGQDHDWLVLENRAKAYVFVTKYQELQSACCYDLSNAVASGDIYSTVLDLLNWDRALATDKILNAKNREAMFTPQTLLETGQKYGLGWMIDHIDGKRVIWHGGSGNGFSSDFARYPDSGLAIAILSNRMTKPHGAYLAKMRNEIARLLSE